MPPPLHMPLPMQPPNHNPYQLNPNPKTKPNHTQTQMNPNVRPSHSPTTRPQSPEHKGKYPNSNTSPNPNTTPKPKTQPNLNPTQPGPKEHHYTFMHAAVNYDMIV